MSDGIKLLDIEQAKNIYRRFGQDFSAYTHFVLIDYNQISTKLAPMRDYRTEHNVGVFLVATDTSDCRHVLCGFSSDAERAQFLATPGILITRTEE